MPTKSQPAPDNPEAWAIFGAGGHGKVVYDALQTAHPGQLVYIYDDDPGQTGRAWLDTTIQIFDSSKTTRPRQAHIAIGSNQARCDRTRLWLEQGGSSFSVFHPDAIMARSARIKTGTFIAARSLIGPDVDIAQGVIINHAAIVDHDCNIGPWTHIAPNATLGGGVQVGAHCLIGASATILPGRRIANNAVVGAGAVVTRDIAAGTTVVGCPARPL